MLGRARRAGPSCAVRSARSPPTGSAARRPASSRPTTRPTCWRSAGALGGRPVPVLVVGQGSNLLVADAGFGGVAVHLGGRRSAIEVDAGRGPPSRAGAAVGLPVVARRSVEAGLRGFEWAVGRARLGRRRGAHERRRPRLGHGRLSVAATRWMDLAGDAGRRGRPRAPRPLLPPLLARAERGGALGRAGARPGRPGGRPPGRWPTSCGGAGPAPAGREQRRLGVRQPAGGLGRPRSSTRPAWRAAGSARRAVSTKHANFIQADEGGSADDVCALMGGSAGPSPSASASPSARGPPGRIRGRGEPEWARPTPTLGRAGRAASPGPARARAAPARLGPPPRRVRRELGRRRLVVLSRAGGAGLPGRRRVAARALALLLGAGARRCAARRDTGRAEVLARGRTGDPPADDRRARRAPPRAASRRCPGCCRRDGRARLARRRARSRLSERSRRLRGRPRRGGWAEVDRTGRVLADVATPPPGLVRVALGRGPPAPPGVRAAAARARRSPSRPPCRRCCARWWPTIAAAPDGDGRPRAGRRGAGGARAAPPSSGQVRGHRGASWRGPSRAGLGDRRPRCPSRPRVSAGSDDAGHRAGHRPAGQAEGPLLDPRVAPSYRVSTCSELSTSIEG